MVVFNTIEVRRENKVILHWVSQLGGDLMRLRSHHVGLVDLSLGEVPTHDWCWLPHVLFRLNFDLITLVKVDLMSVNVDEF